MRMRIVLVLCWVLALTVGVAIASAGNGNGGNSTNAKLCQQGGWQTMVRSDRRSFMNEGNCTSYGARSGTLTTNTKSQLDCETIGGTYSSDASTNQLGYGTFLWSCVGYTTSSFLVLVNDCLFVDGGDTFGFVNPSTLTSSSSCIKEL